MAGKGRKEMEVHHSNSTVWIGNAPAQLQMYAGWKAKGVTPQRWWVCFFTSKMLMKMVMIVCVFSVLPAPFTHNAAPAVWPNLRWIHPVHKNGSCYFISEAEQMSDHWKLRAAARNREYIEPARAHLKCFCLDFSKAKMIMEMRLHENVISLDTCKRQNSWLLS